VPEREAEASAADVIVDRSCAEERESQIRHALGQALQLRLVAEWTEAALLTDATLVRFFSR
jgi:hypothetical protein